MPTAKQTKILQVNLVMSILLYVMVLVYLYGIQATNMENSRQGQQQQQQQQQQQHQQQQQQPSPDPLNSLIIQLLQADLTRGRTRGNQTQQGKSRDTDHRDALPPLHSANLVPEERGDAEQWGEAGRSGESNASVDEGQITMLNSDLLRQHKRFNSPRVLLSDRAPLQPPPLYMADDFVSGGPEGETSGNKTRKKRYTEHKSYRGEYSVCDSESQWVTDKTQGVDTRGTPVTVLGKIKTSVTQDIKQYFYETRCQTPRPFKGGCRGIDDKNWNSQCKTTQTYVRALTQVRNSVGWRWIRIDTSCVCALSRKRHRT
ncbi:neurotrophin-3 isoform X2 [Phyllopteryx taeniolatus]|uniref:neurotrophin-3 isoform X2 n=1 Tax=Phyllopteryx taeniolatus TaxID=161469 RepID=UPI002AD43FAB|nr:neurotrophin-3 isoform X2 [Phyllopteryx taeniolatus]XP_061618243.1 neurotrophin-3 isoform X2 [Phyllopteryx taeniolatus]